MTRGEPAFTLGRRPALDGLRGIAVLLVMAQHAGLPHVQGWGTAGVTLFFVLSGFLITTILRQEHAAKGSIDYRAFYARRIRRLVPGLVPLLGVVALLLALGGQSLLPVALAGGYVTNIAAMVGAGHGPLLHTWTLSLEEQFYLVWPLLLPFVVRRRPALILSLAAGASVALRVGLLLSGATGSRVYYGPDVRADAILIGCALAFVRIPRRHLRPAAAASALFLIATGVADSMARLVWIFTPAAIAAAILIAWAIRHEPRFLTIRPLVGIGKISYGLYLWHFPVSIALRSWAAPLAARTAVFLAVSLALALLSWYLIERPFSRRSDSVSSALQVTVDGPHDHLLSTEREPGSTVDVVGHTLS